MRLMTWRALSVCPYAMGLAITITTSPATNMQTIIMSGNGSGSMVGRCRVTPV
jgi:hypothetical protein